MKVVDMHCDTISNLYDRLKAGEKVSVLSNGLHLDLGKMKGADYLLQNFALYVDVARDKRPLEHVMKLLDLFYRQMEEYSEYIGVVTSYGDIEENLRNGRMSALLTMEEGAACMGELAFLRNFYRMGVRMMTLTWNHKNELAYPNVREVTNGKIMWRADTEHGLTKTGMEFLGEMERLGMIIDVSHLSDAGIWDVFRHTKKPFVASHSNARTVAPHPRNLTDEMIRAMAERGGVAGINYNAAFLRDLSNGGEDMSRIKDMVAHIRHFKKIGGIECVGLGSDFDGISSALEMESAAGLPLLAQEMKKAGFTEAEIEAVFYKNVLRIYQEILK